MNYTKKFIYNEVNKIYKLGDCSMLATTEQRTKIFKLFADLSGQKIERKNVHNEIYNFFGDFVNTGKKHRWLNNIIYIPHRSAKNERIIFNHRIKYFTGKNKNIVSLHPYMVDNDNKRRELALKLTREFLTNKIDNYTKVPLLGKNHLYFCSPNFRFKDYNKIMVCDINLNKTFCEKITFICRCSFKKRTGIDYVTDSLEL